MSEYVYHSLTVTPAYMSTFHRKSIDVVMEAPFNISKGEHIRIRASIEGSRVTGFEITRQPHSTPVRHVPSQPRALFRESESPPDTPSPEPNGPEPPFPDATPGAVNKDAQQVIADLSSSLAEQPASAVWSSQLDLPLQSPPTCDVAWSGASDRVWRQKSYTLPQHLLERKRRQKPSHQNMRSSGSEHQLGRSSWVSLHSR